MSSKGKERRLQVRTLFLSDIHLGFKRSRTRELLAFLHDAIPFYERPGGVRVGLYESVDEPGLYLELVAYEDLAAYEADQDRVEHDPEMIAMLARFRAVVGGPAEVRRMKPVLGVAARADAAVEPAAFNDGPGIAALLAEASLPIPDADDAPVPIVDRVHAAV